MGNEKLYLEIISNLYDGVYFVDTKQRITFWNKASEDITGYEEKDILGTFYHANILNHINKEGHNLCDMGCPLQATLIDGKQRKADVFLKHKNGHYIPVKVNVFPFKQDGEIKGAIEIFTLNTSIAYEDNLIEELSNMAMNDQLTGLPNRRKIENHLEYRFNEMKHYQKKFCVIFLDIDNFSDFNNKYGHTAGDEVLKNISKSVMNTVRKTDLFGRWGGEEFIGVFEIKNNYEGELIAEKIRSLIARTNIPYEGMDLSVTASLGVTLANENDYIDSVVKRSDKLMYESKQKGKNCVTSDIHE